MEAESRLAELKKIWEACMDEQLTQAVVSGPLDENAGKKIKLRPVEIGGALLYQETCYRGSKVFHANLGAEEVPGRLAESMLQNFRQAQIDTAKHRVTVLVSKKGKVTVKRRPADKTEGNGRQELSHNRTKHYILPDGEPVDFLVGLGVQTPDGRVVKAKYDKFRQINRYLEFIEDVLRQLPTDRTVRIIDFGCGKPYLTFAMYHYLHTVKKYDIEVTGLDLKEDVIALCNRLAGEYGYEHLHFERGDISTYEGCDSVDMVVTLHACDTATDYAIERAIRWGAKIIMAVPCCQHEVNRQISNAELGQILKYGLIKERISALITDAVRANLLEEMGYDTQILEFIDMEHTPKNLLIRAVKREGMRPVKQDVGQVTEFLHIQPTLQRLLHKEAPE